MRGEKKEKNCLWLINPLSHHWTSSNSVHMFHRMAAEWSITNTAFLDSKPPQQPCVDGASGFSRSRNNNRFQELLFEPTTSKAEIADFSPRGQRRFSIRHHLTILSVPKKGRWRGGGRAGRRGRSSAMMFRHRNRQISATSPATDFLCGMCDTALLPWGHMWRAGSMCLEAVGAEKQNRGAGDRKGCYHLASAQGRRVSAAHFLSEGHQGQIPGNTHTLIRLADKMVSVATPGQSVACIRH